MSHYFINDKSLDHKEIFLKLKLENKTYNFLSDNGVFSKDKIDYGSLFLIKTLIKNGCNGKVLDVGCGYGPIGIILNSIFNCEVDMVEINERAIELTKKNIESNKVNCNVFFSDIYSNVTDKYDFIVTNPPIRTGKKVVLEFLCGAQKFLKKDGELWFVIRKNHGALSFKKTLEEIFDVKIINKSKGFLVIRAKNH